ncbi:hypothetical protein [Carboxylicivirga sp. M1479]|uniref:hypothetical protein n=1 Tax=Carboxylicivirga sp. M1479 TaxID=2594476 RepID=UPI0011776791|nr:hypothetical protein [Carboxylicivirga sp. M1479]TRX63176.1 hypothetical protein FNN09_18965 [Carboxylicivirga sp. M1479]
MRVLTTIVVFILVLLPTRMMATEQEPDLLIIGNDTLLIKSFPLEDLELKFRPFGLTQETAPSTACWRGYRAVWRVENDSIFLEGIISCSTDFSIRPKIKEQDINEFLEKNNLKSKLVNKKVFADWFSNNMYYVSNKPIKKGIYSAYLFDEQMASYIKKKHKKLAYEIKNGIIKKIE